MRTLILFICGISLCYGLLQNKPLCDKLRDAIRQKITQNTDLTMAEVKKLITSDENCLYIELLALEKLNKNNRPMRRQDCTSMNMAEIICISKTHGFYIAKKFCGKIGNVCQAVKNDLFSERTSCRADNNQLQAIAIQFRMKCSSDGYKEPPNPKILSYLLDTSINMTEYLTKFDKQEIHGLIKMLVKEPKLMAVMRNCDKHLLLKVAHDKGLLSEYATNFTASHDGISRATSGTISPDDKEIVQILLTIVPYLDDKLCKQYKSNLVDKLAMMYNNDNWTSHLSKRKTYFECRSSDSLAKQPTNGNDTSTFKYLQQKKLHEAKVDCRLTCGEQLFKAVVTNNSKGGLDEIQNQFGDLASCADTVYLRNKISNLSITECANLTERVKEIIRSDSTLAATRNKICKSAKAPENFTEGDFTDCATVCQYSTYLPRYPLIPLCNYWKTARTTCKKNKCQLAPVGDKRCKNDIAKADRVETLTSKEMDLMSSEEKERASDNLVSSGSPSNKKKQKENLLGISIKKQDFDRIKNNISKLREPAGLLMLNTVKPSDRKNIVDNLQDISNDDLKVIDQSNVRLPKTVLRAMAKKAALNKTADEIGNMPINFKKELNASEVCENSTDGKAACIKALAKKSNDETPSRKSLGAGKKGMVLLKSLKETLAEEAGSDNLAGILTTALIATLDASIVSAFNHTDVELMNQNDSEAAIALCKKYVSHPYFACISNKERRRDMAKACFTIMGFNFDNAQSTVDEKFVDVAPLLVEMLLNNSISLTQLTQGFFDNRGHSNMALGPTAINESLSKDVAKLLVQNYFSVLFGGAWSVMARNTQDVTSDKRDSLDVNIAQNENYKSNNEKAKEQRECTKIDNTESERTKNTQAQKDFDRGQADAKISGDSLITSGNSGNTAGKKRKKRSITVYTCAQLQAIADSEVVSRMTEVNIAAMDASEFSSCIAHLGSLSGWSTSQYRTLFDKAMTSLNIPSPYSALTSVESEMIGTIAQGLLASEINGLTNITDMIGDFGVLTEWATDQLQAIATRYLSVENIANTADLTSSNLILMGHAVCGLSPSQISTINATAYLDAAVTLNNMTTTASACLTALASLAQHVSAYGPANAWDSDSYDAAGILIGGLSASVLNLANSESIEMWGSHIAHIPPSVFQQLSASVIQEIPREDTIYVTESQKSGLSALQLNALSTAQAGIAGNSVTVVITTDVDGGSMAVTAAVSMVLMTVISSYIIG